MANYKHKEISAINAVRNNEQLDLVVESDVKGNVVRYSPEISLCITTDKKNQLASKDTYSYLEGYSNCGGSTQRIDYNNSFDVARRAK